MIAWIAAPSQSLSLLPLILPLLLLPPLPRPAFLIVIIAQLVRLGPLGRIGVGGALEVLLETARHVGHHFEVLLLQEDALVPFLLVLGPAVVRGI